MNKFEQVSSLGHQMSLAGGTGPCADEGRGAGLGPCTGGGCTWEPPPVNKQTRLKTLPSRKFVGGR